MMKMKKKIIYQKKEKVNLFLKLLMMNKINYLYILKDGWEGFLVWTNIKHILSRNLNNFKIIFYNELNLF